MAVGVSCKEASHLSCWHDARIRCNLWARHRSVSSGLPRVQQTHTVATAVRTAMGDVREVIEAVLTVNDHQVDRSVFGRVVLRSLVLAYSGRARMLSLVRKSRLGVSPLRRRSIVCYLFVLHSIWRPTGNGELQKLRPVFNCTTCVDSVTRVVCVSAMTCPRHTTGVQRGRDHVRVSASVTVAAPVGASLSSSSCRAPRRLRRLPLTWAPPR